jgi:hypothetical protein
MPLRLGDTNTSAQLFYAEYTGSPIDRKDSENPVKYNNLRKNTKKITIQKTTSSASEKKFCEVVFAQDCCFSP